MNLSTSLPRPWARCPLGVLVAGALAIAWSAPVRSSAAADAETQTIAIADGKLQMKAPASWQVKEPANRIIEHEFAIPKAEGDEKDGRMTLMGAGGSVDANIKRWAGQFKTAEGGEVEPKVSTKNVAGQEIHLVDLKGTYDDRPPFAGGGVQRPGYRMLSAIISSKETGNYFVKLYGPEKTIAANEKAFYQMIDSLERK